MLISVVLCGAGFASEYVRYRTDPKLSAKVESLEGQLSTQAKEHEAALVERDAEINRKRLLIAKYKARVETAAKKNENIIKNLKLIAAVTPAKFKPYLTEAIDTLRTPWYSMISAGERDGAWDVLALPPCGAGTASSSCATATRRRDRGRRPAAC